MNLKKVIIQCPICHSIKNLEIPKEVISNAKSLVTISVPENLICEHKFQAYIDKNYAVRGYQKVDFYLPLDVIEKKLDYQLLSESDLADAEAVKWNISPENLSYILRGILFKKNVAFVVPESKQSLVVQLERFLNSLFQKTFKLNLSILTEPNYKKIKSTLKKDLVIGWKKVLNDPDKIMKLKQMEVEKKVVGKFFRKPSKYDAMIDLEYEIRMIHSISNHVIEIVNNLEKEEIIDHFKIIDLLKENYSIDVEIQYLNYILNVVQFYFKIYVPIEEAQVYKFSSYGLHTGMKFVKFS